MAAVTACDFAHAAFVVVATAAGSELYNCRLRAQALKDSLDNYNHPIYSPGGGSEGGDNCETEWWISYDNGAHWAYAYSTWGRLPDLDGLCYASPVKRLTQTPLVTEGINNETQKTYYLPGAIAAIGNLRLSSREAWWRDGRGSRDHCRGFGWCGLPGCGPELSA